MYWIIRFVVVILSHAVCVITVAANPLTMRSEPPDFYKRLNRDNTWDLYLEGEIDSGAPARLNAELSKIGSARIHLSSPGGSLFAGLELGRVIRKFGASTDILKKIPGSNKSQPANCMSACSLAFLGGDYRYIFDGSVYGVHRVSSSSGPTISDLDAGQILSAAISTYIREMGVDPGLFDLMVQAGKDEIYVLSRAQAKALNVTNDGRKQPEWTIEATKGGQFLRGVQETIYGEGKVLLVCIKGSLWFQSFYLVGDTRANEIVSEKRFHSLMIGESMVPLSDPAEFKKSNRYVYTLFLLTADQSRLISSATSIGHAMQYSREAPFFVGHQVDMLPSSLNRIRGYIDNCLTSR